MHPTEAENLVTKAGVSASLRCQDPHLGEQGQNYKGWVEGNPDQLLCNDQYLRQGSCGRRGSHRLHRAIHFIESSGPLGLQLIR